MSAAPPSQLPRSFVIGTIEQLSETLSILTRENYVFATNGETFFKIHEMSKDNKLKPLFDRIRVYARMKPHQKAQLVELLQ
jgi:magnesium-transporting ATPase (P-type)